MRLPRWRSPFAARRLLRSLDRLVGAVEAQTVLLVRLADHFAPAVPIGATPDDSVSYTDEGEMITALDYIERTRVATGHTPSDDEVIAYIAEEHTQALQSRLNERAELLARIGER